MNSLMRGSVRLMCLLAVLVMRGAFAQDDLERKLESLSPIDPEGYFLLAEDVAGSSSGIEDVRLARRLYVLAFVLAQKEQAGGEDEASFPIAASACLGLASLETAEDRKRWLRALAGRLDERYSARRWDSDAENDTPSEAGLLLAEAIGLALSGDGSLARQRFDDPRVSALLEETRDIIDRPGTEASTSAIQHDAEVWPCPECGNARGVPDRAEGGQVKRLCSTCRGNPGPVISRDAYIAYLAYQSMLLHGTQKSWSAELVVGRGRTLLDPEPAEVAPSMGVDASKVYYRDGKWLDSQELMELQDHGE